MHEWALAEAVLDTIIQQASGRRIVRVELAFGDLQNVDETVFREGLRSMAAERTDAANLPAIDDLISIGAEAAAFRCRHCDRRWTLAESEAANAAGGAGATEEIREAIHFMPEAALAYLSCPQCGAPDFEIIAGRGVTIRALELGDEIQP